VTSDDCLADSILSAGRARRALLHGNLTLALREHAAANRCLGQALGYRPAERAPLEWPVADLIRQALDVLTEDLATGARPGRVAPAEELVPLLMESLRAWNAAARLNIPEGELRGPAGNIAMVLGFGGEFEVRELPGATTHSPSTGQNRTQTRAAVGDATSQVGGGGGGVGVKHD
jgi:hypothetical protein